MFGIPSIASNVGGTQEAVLHNETGIIINNLDKLETAISDLIGNETKMKHLGEKAKKRAETQLSWATIVKDYEKLIAKIIL